MIQLHEVGLRYGIGRGGVDVLRAVNAEIPAGAFRWVLGASGAGKSSLLRLLNLGARPSGGRMELFGVSVMRARRSALARLRRRTGTVYQELRLLPELSAFDNVALRLRLDGLAEDRVEAEVTEMLRWVGLGRKLHVRPTALSGGEQQRVAVARAVVHRPPLLLADELVAHHNEALVRRHPMPALRLERGRLVGDG